MSEQPFPLEPSLWAATAVNSCNTSPLQVDSTFDVAVVGAGFAGLNTALVLAQRGVSVAVFDTHEVGYGGSGRNGGQVIPGLKYDPEDLLAKFGKDRGKRLVQFAASTADSVFDLIQEHQLDVPRVRNGWIQGAHNEASVTAVKRRAEQWARLGVDCEFLDQAEVARHLGTNKYLAGWIDRRGGGVQPLSYAREIGRIVLAKGGKIFTGSSVDEIKQTKDGWALSLSNGVRVKAGKVAICTNGYTGSLWPNLQKTIIAPNSFQVATAPLPESVRATILPEGQVSSDTRNLLLYFRLDHTGRLLMGGRGPFREPRSVSDWRHLENVIKKLYPQAADVPIEYRWCGRVAVTRDYLPHIHEPAPGLTIDIGCMGRGVGLQTSMGQALGKYLIDADQEHLPFPIRQITPLPLYGMRKLYVGAIIVWYQMTDGGL